MEAARFVASGGIRTQSRKRCAKRWTLEESLAYTRWLATHHYENFHVVSFLLPKRLHQDFYNVYAYCRWADDLGDEMGDTAESLRLLAWWRGELDAMYAGPRHASGVRGAWAEPCGKYGIPREPFSDLIDAFVQDQTVTRYRDWDELFGYCRNSANPVGRLVLYLGGYSDAERQRLSDATCTALQLANFWQDVTVDLQKDRVYIPLEVMSGTATRWPRSARGEFNGAFRAVMREIVAKARELFPKACRWWAWWTGAWRSISISSTAAACACSTRSRAGLQRAGGAAGDFESGARGAAARRRSRASAFSRAATTRPDMREVDQSYDYCVRVARSRAKNFYYSFLLLSKPQRKRHVRHLRLHALLRRPERRSRRQPRRH